ncbi:MAG: ATP-binding protein [Granulosicoccaceae bacterium]
MAQPRRKDNTEAPIGMQVREAAMRSNQALLLVDGVNLNIIDVNDATHAVLGYPLEILLGLRLVDTVAIKDRDRVLHAIHSLGDGSTWSHRLLCDALRGDQSTHPVSLTIEVDADPRSSRTKLLVSLSEVSESEQLYLSMETALAAANISFSSWSLGRDELAPQDQDHPHAPQRRRTSANDFLSKLNPADRRETLALLDALSGGERPLDSIDTTVSTIEPDGSKRWLRLTGIVPPHKPSTLLALHTDVTENYRIKAHREKREKLLREVENKLQRSESELHELLALIPDFIVRLDTRAVIKYASPSFINDCQRGKQTLGAGALEGSSLISALGVEARASFSDALGQLSESVQMHEFVSEEAYGGKERHVWWTLLKMDDDCTDKGVLCLGRDITERSRARQQLERQAKQLKRSNASLDDFASIVSHDLQAPLRHIASFSDLLAANLSDTNEENAGYLEVLKSSTKKLQDMTSNLLNFSRLGLQYERMAKRYLAELIAEAIDMLAEPMKTSQARVQISQLPEIHVDPLLMSRLFQNLLSNSIKYCEPGFTPEVQISAEREGENWIIYWEDQGIGISPENSERIFQIFTRLHSDESVYAGSGVGLALCKRIVESHGGDIWLDTDYQAGARFAIRLPIIDEDEPIAQV